MGIPVFVLGRSGTGKSTSLRNFKSNEILHINVMSKPLPFKGRFAESYNGDDYAEIAKAINKTKKKVIVVDDAQYLMTNEFMRRSTELGYQKFTDIANNFWTLVNGVTADLDWDVIVYFLMHTDTDDNGNEKAKTIGKLLDEKICIEGMATIVLKTAVKDGNYMFLTQNNGKDTTKSPLGMFKTYEIDNDLKGVDKTIREYWDLDIPFEDSAEIMAAHDAEVDAGGVSTDAPKAETGRRSRRKRDNEETPAEVSSKPADAPTEDTAETTTRRRRKRTEAAETPTGDVVKECEEEPAEEKPRRRRRRIEDAEGVEKEVEEVSDMIKSAEAVEVTTEEKPSRRRRRASEDS
jgi:hypothetical protein